MKAKMAESIRCIFDMIEEDYADKSLEFQIEITCQMAKVMGLEIGASDVTEALQKTKPTR